MDKKHTKKLPQTKNTTDKKNITKDKKLLKKNCYRQKYY